MKFIFIDSDIFARDLRYRHDKNLEINELFIKKIRKGTIKAATSIFNVLEVCGIMSYNLKPERLMSLYEGFPTYYNLKVLFPADSTGNLQYDLGIILQKIFNKQNLGDAQISYVIERFSKEISCLVSWNASHFEGKISVPVKTPAEFLK